MLRLLLHLLPACVLTLAMRVQARDVEDVPNPRRSHGGWVTDEAVVLGSAVTELERRLDALHRDMGDEVAVVILDSIGDEHPRDFVNELFKYWGLGKKGTDNGVLVLHVLDRRRVEIETGYGLEGRLPDAKVSWLIDEVARPQFHDGEFARGHLALSFGLDKALREPDATHDALVDACNTYASSLPSSPTATWHRLARVLGPDTPGPGRTAWFWAPLALISCLATYRWLRRSHQRYYGPDHAALAPKFLGGWAFAVGITTFFAVFFSFLITKTAYQVTFSILYLTYVTFMGRAAWRMRIRLRERAHVTCTTCRQGMQRLEGEQTLEALSDGQRREMQLGSVHYDAWRCACGRTRVLRRRGAEARSACPRCGFFTLAVGRLSIVREATPNADGVSTVGDYCGFCSYAREETQRYAWRTRANAEVSSDDARSSSDADSSSSSSSSSDSGSDFGGGSSGGGGAGGDY